MHKKYALHNSKLDQITSNDKNVPFPQLMKNKENKGWNYSNKIKTSGEFCEDDVVIKEYIHWYQEHYPFSSRANKQLFVPIYSFLSFSSQIIPPSISPKFLLRFEDHHDIYTSSTTLYNKKLIS
jgi:hypothetical protein